jgi:hypothetical protein
MSDPAAMIALSSAALVATGLASIAALKGWRGWLELKQLEIAHPMFRDGIVPSPAARIELADLKERVRKLEAIASGVDI